MSAAGPPSDASRTWRCGVAARWLPRALGGAALALGTAVALSIAPEAAGPFARRARLALALAGAGVALWLVRKGAEVRRSVRLEGHGVVLEQPGASAELAFADIENLRYEPPFAASRAAWLPALVLVDGQGRRWRIPALVERGEELVERLVEAAGRADLAAWATALELGRRMARVRLRLAVGYAISAACVVAAAWVLSR